MNKENLIEKYLHGTITDEELDVFLKLIEEDQSFADQLEIESVFYANRNKKIKSELLEVKEKQKNFSELKDERKTKIRKKRRFNPILIAALILLPVVAFIAIQTSLPSGDQHLVSQFLETPFEAPPSLMNDAPIKNDNWTKAQSAYKNNNFSEAAQLISALENRTEQQELYLGLSHLFNEQSNLNKSLTSLELVVNKPNGQFKDIALWYAALNTAKQGENEIAKKYLNEIVSSNSWNYKKAKQLLHQLN